MTKNSWNYTQSTYVEPCHTGNTPLYQSPNGGTLFIGGWSKGAFFDENIHVIDLTGAEHRFQEIPLAMDPVSERFMEYLAPGYAGWLSLPFPDYKTPKNLQTRAQWEGIAKIIFDILETGTDVLVACQGGHGRSGLFCSIVGYLLAVNEDRSWASPVEKIRKMHCDEAVETYEQEKYVYGILGLNIQITHQYIDTQGFKSYTYKDCPICGKGSMYVDEYGMCLACKTQYEKVAPTRADLTLNDIKDKGMVVHDCKRDKCVGIWKAEKCGHVVHDQIISNGFCYTCNKRIEKEEEDLDFIPLSTNDTDVLERCAICGDKTMYATRFGVCYECSEAVITQGAADYVHNTITDPYQAVPHKCNDVACRGLVIADQCNHVVHNREVEDGLCQDCRVMQNKRRNKKEEA